MAVRPARVLGTLVAIAALAVGLLWPVAWAWLQTAGTAEVSDPVTISSYAADYRVDADGTLATVETITAEFPFGRRGIFRYWDLADAADSGVRYVPELEQVTRDGRPERYELSWVGGYRFLVARIGDPDVFLDGGTHVYRLVTTTPGTLSPGTTAADAPFVSTAGTDGAPPAGSAFLWSVVASGWEMPISRADITIALPDLAGTLGCVTDPAGSPGPCVLAGLGTPTVQAAADALAPRTGMVLRAGMAAPAPARATLPWSITWDPVLGRTPWVTAALVLAAAVTFTLARLAARSAREPSPGFPVQYEPPAGLGPVQAAYLDSETAGPSPLVASLLYLADRGLVRLERPSADHWRVVGVGTPAQWQAVDPVSRSVATDLAVTGSGRFEADGTADAGQTLQRVTDAIDPALADWSVAAGLMAPSERERLARALWFTALLVTGVLFVLPALAAWAGLLWVVPTLVALPVAAAVLGGAGLAAAGVGRRRTAQGRLAWARAGGFRRLLSTPSAEDRFDFSARTDAFVAFIPYAVAFGVADRWAEKYRATTGQEPPVPAWYPGYAGTVGRDFYSGGGFDSFGTVLAASVGAYVASQASSSSSGGGGGGGSVGGGGGGGGGSW